MFDPVDPKQSFPELEHHILEYWKYENTFKRSISQREGSKVFSFYDGPPFATGLPHYGHLLAGTIKDVIPRYKTMRGHQVQRRFGWDCHGLPVENIVEQEEGIQDKAEIEKKGVKWFNDKCRASVQRYTGEWRKTVERTGRWVDMDWDYRTMDPDYMESIWWVFKSVHDKGLIYEGHKPMHICPRCVTPLSNFEVTQGYKDVTDVSVTVKFEIEEKSEERKEKNKTYFLAWTTTPWTLPGNLFLAVGDDIEYAEFVNEKTGERFIAAEKYARSFYVPAGRKEPSDPEYSCIRLMKGSEMVNWKFKPLFPYFVDQYKDQNAFKVVEGDFVTDEDGTGIVHIAPGFGEDDCAVGRREGVEILQHIHMDGKFVDAVTDFACEEVKPVNDPSRTDKKVIDWLKEKKLLFKVEKFSHSYPHCWRCDSPLLNYATSSWFVAVEKIKQNLLKANAKTEWVPAHIRDGRFGNWLENARDWAISRNRYWGTPLPVWRLDCHGESLCHTELAERIDTGEDTQDKRGQNMESNDVALRQAQGDNTKQAHGDNTKQAHGDNTKQAQGDNTKQAQGDNTKQAHGDVAIEVIGSRDALMRKVPIRFTKMTVVRHAESEGNTIPIYQGEVPGTGLTRDGKKQAKEAAIGLTRKGQHPSLREDFIEPGIIYCSPLQRTQETAQIIAKKTGAKVIVDDRLRELSFGEYEGKTVDFSDLAFIRGRREHKWKTGQPESIYHFTGMETWESVRERVDLFLQEVLSRHRGEHVLVVTHADPFQNFKLFFTGEDPFKLSHQPYPQLAHSQTFFWDHRTEAQMDLHKDTVDEITWGSDVIVDLSSRACREMNHGEKKDLAFRQAQGDKKKKIRDDTVEVILVRHGETDWNKERKVQGSSDIELNATGRDQARSLARKLKGQKIDVIISSPLKRAVATAQILSEELDIPFSTQWDEFQERDMGENEGKKVEDVLKDSPLSDGIFGVAFHHATPEGGESFDAVMRRAEKALQMLREQYAGKKVVVVSHGGMGSFLLSIVRRLNHREGVQTRIPNAGFESFTLTPLMRRISEVFDCWVESGSMPYAQYHYPFENHASVSAKHASPLQKPSGFPANFIAEGLDQTRGWFYTLMVLSTALFDQPAFQHCVVNGIVLAEDGKKMSKRLKNYPDPDLVMDKYGADAMRFTLMESPAVRGENLRFSEKAVEETLRRVILPLWNTYSFFVTHANAALFKPSPPQPPSPINSHSKGSVEVGGNNLMKRERGEALHPLDQWIRAEVQDLVNRMTEQLDRFDLSATCSELYETIDALTNWYVRLSRRRFAGKDERVEGGASCGGACPASTDSFDTLYDVLITICQLLAPFCPFISESVYLNLAAEPNGSIHLTDWPTVRDLSVEEKALLEKTRLMRRIVSLGHAVRGEHIIKVRQPLASAIVGLPSDVVVNLSEEDMALLRQELNVKEISFVDDPGEVAQEFLQVDARKVGPRLGKKVQEVIRAGKEGNYELHDDGSVTILDEKLSADEAQVVYRGKEGCPVASEEGIVVCMDVAITEELKKEGMARDVIRFIQQQRKDKGLNVSDQITLEFSEKIIVEIKDFIEYITSETNALVDSKYEGKHLIIESFSSGKSFSSHPSIQGFGSDVSVHRWE